MQSTTLMKPSMKTMLHLAFNKKYNSEIRKMFRKYKELWSGRLGNVNITQHRIDLIPGVVLWNLLFTGQAQKLANSNSSKSISNWKPETSNTRYTNGLPQSFSDRRKMEVSDFVFTYVKWTRWPSKNPIPYLEWTSISARSEKPTISHP